MGNRRFKQDLVIQPKFAPQIQNLTSPLGVSSPLQRGYMIWTEKNFNGYTGGPLGDGRDMINFLFNPSTVSADFQGQMTGQQGVMQFKYSGDKGNYAPIPLQQTASWQLYFDRTYELMYGGNSSAINDPAVIGCQADVYQFMQFTGMTATADQSQADIFKQVGNNALAEQVIGTLRTNGLLQFVPALVVFGSAGAQLGQNPNSSNFNAVGAQVQFSGFINEWSVEYTHWTQNMVPIRCAISVNFTMMANPSVPDTMAVWRDSQKLGLAPSTSPIPYAPGQGPTGIPGVNAPLH